MGRPRNHYRGPSVNKNSRVCISSESRVCRSSERRGECVNDSWSIRWISKDLKTLLAFSDRRDPACVGATCESFCRSLIRPSAQVIFKKFYFCKLGRGFKTHLVSSTLDLQKFRSRIGYFRVAVELDTFVTWDKFDESSCVTVAKKWSQDSAERDLNV